MQEVSARAALVAAPDLPDGLSTSVSREEIADALREDGRPMPRARTLTELKADADAAADIETYLIALIPFEPAALRPAAE